MILSGRLASPKDVDRFYVEARSAGKLIHPNIVDVYEVGEIDGHHFFSMEYVAGSSLADLTGAGPLPADRAARYVQIIARAVHFAHQQGVLHRDLKPSNVLIDGNDEPRITDFGLAKDLDSQSHLTSTGAALGTPSYMSPEQAQADHDRVDARSDVYSLGAILYELLTGQRPFVNPAVATTILQVIHADPTPPTSVNRRCDRDLEAICLKCLHKDPGRRYQTADELASDLRRFLLGQPVRARPASPIQRVWHWLRDVPVVAAVLGRRFIGPTAWHLRLQWSLLLLLLLCPIATVGWRWLHGYAQLRTIDICAGPAHGTYDQVARHLAGALSNQGTTRVRVHGSQGSVDSLRRVQQGQADIAFLQENALPTSTDVCVLAPLYYESTLVLARAGSGIEGVSGLRGRKVALGAELSGMRLSALRILSHFDISLDSLRATDQHVDALLTDPDLDAALVTIRLDNPHLATVLSRVEVRLLPIRHAERIPGFRSAIVFPEDLPSVALPATGIPTAQTMAMLVVRRGTPFPFVTRCLQALYNPATPGWAGLGVFSRDEAAAWPELNLHPAAHAFFAGALDEGETGWTATRRAR
jgi:TRAP transporter TAXI family solute receptor